MSTESMFIAHNARLLRGLIDSGKPEALYCIDPKHEDFDKPLNQVLCC